MFGLFVFAKAVITSLVALLTFLTFRRLKMPQLEYTVWLGFLLILILPPLVSVPIWKNAAMVQVDTDSAPVEARQTRPVPRSATTEPTSVSPVAVAETRSPTFSDSNSIADSNGNGARTSASETLAETVNGKVRSNPVPPRLPELAEPLNQEVTEGPALATLNSAPVQDWKRSASFLFLGIWLLGSVLFAFRSFAKLRFLGSLVAMAEEAPLPLRERNATLAGELGIRRAPDLVIANGSFSPFLWHPILGPAKVILPESLATEFSANSVEIVLRHELIHFRRRDSWRRRLELLIASIWWWLPTIWIARNRLGKLEELCTDAEVLRTSPISPKAYATALLDTEQFLADSVVSPTPLVPTFTDPQLLKARIQMIANSSKIRSNAKLLRLFSVAIGLLAIPVGILTAGTVPQTESATTPPAREVQEKTNSIARSTRTSSYTVDGDSQVSLSTNDESVSITLNQDGIRKSVTMKRRGEKKESSEVWDVVKYENSESDRGEDDHDWLFGGLNLDTIVVHEGTEYRHPDLKLLPDLLRQAASANPDELLESTKTLISTEGRGRVTAALAARDDLPSSSLVPLLKVLSRDDLGPRFSVADEWESMAPTVDMILQRDDLNDEANELIRKLRYHDPEYRASIREKRLAEREKRISESSKRAAKAKKRSATESRKSKRSTRASDNAEASESTSRFSELEDQTQKLRQTARDLRQTARDLERQLEELRKQKNKTNSLQSNVRLLAIHSRRFRRL